MRRIGCALALLLSAGCLVVNPGFDEPVGESGSSSTTSPTTTASTHSPSTTETSPTSPTAGSSGSGSTDVTGVSDTDPTNATSDASAGTTDPTGTTGVTLEPTSDGTTTDPTDPSDTGTSTDADPTTGTSTGGQQEFSCEADDSVVGCYEFEMISDELIDGSIYQNHGTAFGAVNAPGVSGQAVFIEENTVLRAPSSESLLLSQQLTLEAWIRPLGLPQTLGSVISKKGQFHLYIREDGKFGCDLVPGPATVAGVIEPEVWTHIACVYTGDSFLVYQDGVPLSEVQAGGQLTTGPEDLIIGNSAPGFMTPFPGAIDSARLWSVGLNEQTICEHAKPNCP